MLKLEIGYEEQGKTYLRQAGSGQVFAFPGRVGHLFKRSPNGYRDRTILDFDAQKIDRLTVQNHRGRFTMARDDQTGSFYPLDKQVKNFNTFRAEQLVTAAAMLRAKGFVDEPVDVSEVGLATGAARITLHLQDEDRPRTVTIKLGKTIDDQRTTYLSTSESPQIYLISRHIASFLVTAAEDFARTAEEVIAEKRAREFAEQHAREHRKRQGQAEKNQQDSFPKREEWGDYVVGQKIPDQVLEVLYSLEKKHAPPEAKRQ